jgi:ABC-2 type transport system ATP-binding protein
MGKGKRYSKESWGEIALPESLTGTQFINMMAESRGLKDMKHTDFFMQ